MARLKGFKNLTNVNDALRLFLKELNPTRLSSEKIAIQNALGRITAHDIYAKHNLPYFDRSAVDGYALKAEDTVGISAFKTKSFKLTKGEVHRNEVQEVWTGNPIPKGSNAVVMLEYTKKIDNKIELSAAITPGRNISKSGEDVIKGEVAVQTGTRLSPHHLGLLAALGETKISVVRKPKVAILATGNELVEFGKNVELGKIIETNQLILSSLCIQIGADPQKLGIAKDDINEIKTKIKLGLNQADAIITTGGTSVGYPDLVPLAVNQIGKPGVIVHGIAIRPGMPTGLAIIENKPIFILSGNPVAATIGFEVFTRSILFSLLGTNETRPIIEAKLTSKVAGVLGRRVFLRVQVFEKNKIFYAEPVRVTGSGIITTITKANGYVIIPEDHEGVNEGTRVRVYLFSNVKSD